MKKKTALTKMHIAPSTVCYDAVAARDSNEVGLILASIRKRNGYSLVAFSELLRHYGVDVSDKGINKWEKGYTTPSIYQLVAICYALNIKEGPSYFTRNFQKPALLNDIGQKKLPSTKWT
ncbi:MULTISPECIES: helix-turn-helix domain-containing protein [Faecalibacterium]|jgi:transcriptional regulator with XRE-family HTH domain|uniref:helix-turn-helix domain-containing protein n=1 Tax=Faecalibacterium TaxID=216851 RepID=UPI001FA9FE43|nr:MULTISPECIES: helix-turn-helix transcriptional regulator [Faecalibacterium]